MKTKMSPKELAESLKVPLYPSPPILPATKVSGDIADFANGIKTFMETTIAVCETCGKEIKNKTSKEPCGKQRCPFGELKM